jgi:methylmalonyl-CoA mutase
MTPEYGAATQLEKIDMIDFANIIALNKFDKKGALDALRDVKKQYQRNHNLWDSDLDTMPVFGTIASQFNDPGTNNLYSFVIEKINEQRKEKLKSNFAISNAMSEKQFIIPPKRVRYLSEITENNQGYDKWSKEQSNIAQSLYGLFKSIETLTENSPVINTNGINITKLKTSNSNKEIVDQLIQKFTEIKMDLNPHNWGTICNFNNKKQLYKNEIYTFKVRDKEINIKTHVNSLSHLKIPKIVLPKYLLKNFSV